jgi:hypothetical protein
MVTDTFRNFLVSFRSTARRRRAVALGLREKAGGAGGRKKAGRRGVGRGRREEAGGEGKMGDCHLS